MEDVFETLPTIDISWKYGTGLAKSLSNLAPRRFTVDGSPVEFASIEAALQSLKFKDPEAIARVAGMTGGSAWVAGQHGNDWKVDQMLNFGGLSYWRDGIAYQNLLDRIYLAAYTQTDLAELLEKSKGHELVHSRGVTDPRNTVLTPAEYITRLERLRDGKVA